MRVCTLDEIKERVKEWDANLNCYQCPPVDHCCGPNFKRSFPTNTAKKLLGKKFGIYAEKVPNYELLPEFPMPLEWCPECEENRCGIFDDRNLYGLGLCFDFPFYAREQREGIIGLYVYLDCRTVQLDWEKIRSELIQLHSQFENILIEVSYQTNGFAPVTTEFNRDFFPGDLRLRMDVKKEHIYFL